jgi:acyl-CoA thioester hydrolase
MGNPTRIVVDGWGDTTDKIVQPANRGNSMPAVFDFEHTIGDGEIDAQGHVNNLEYLRWMQSAAVAHSVAQGWPAERYQQIGAGWVVRSHHIEYLRPAFAGEKILVRTWVSDFRKITSLRKYRILRVSDAEILAVAQTNWAFIGLERRVPRRVPSELVESFIVVADDDVQ